jgi:murein DD-endopeptidase MepM/ murein hydrolase activator NlpD
VHTGDRVRQGQVVGFEGSTGNSTGPHVHFEIRSEGGLLDPAPFLAGQLPAA